MPSCTYGHQNPPGTSFCATCGLALIEARPQDPVVQPAYVSGQPPLVQETMPPAKASRGWILPVALVGVLAVVGAGILAFQALKPKTTTLTVTLDLYNGSDGCNVGLGYNDVPGAMVLISGDGQPVATGNLDYFGTDNGYYCEFTATLVDVPTDKSIYQLSLGSGNRGVLTSTQSELVAGGWDWPVTLGE